ncbi:MAG: site-2 protease family protein [Candidatus Liptonbacteria bacterium]|nr:site-2 protease family protein [Candidatus Liptonbacteria bacterium]
MNVNILFLIFQLCVLIFSVMIHEISHGFVAEKLGDPTARLAGRLTLNPLRHIDLFGSIILPLVLFLGHSPVVLGWAKPVPYNPFNLRKDFKYGPLKVALAGPISNILILLILGGGARIAFSYLSPALVSLFAFVAFLNVSLAVFNLLPIPPLDGSKILPLLFPKIAFNIERFGFYGIFFVFIFLMFFSKVIAVITTYIFVLVSGPQVATHMFQFFNTLSR